MSVFLYLFVGEVEALDQQPVQLPFGAGIDVLIGDIVVKGKAHRDIILVFVDIQVVFGRNIPEAFQLQFFLFLVI